MHQPLDAETGGRSWIAASGRLSALREAAHGHGSSQAWMKNVGCNLSYEFAENLLGTNGDEVRLLWGDGPGRPEDSPVAGGPWVGATPDASSYCGEFMGDPKCHPGPAGTEHH